MDALFAADAIAEPLQPSPAGDGSPRPRGKRGPPPGTPKPAGSGRKPGTGNRVSREAKSEIQALVDRHGASVFARLFHIAHPIQKGAVRHELFRFEKKLADTIAVHRRLDLAGTLRGVVFVDLRRQDRQAVATRGHRRAPLAKAWAATTRAVDTGRKKSNAIRCACRSK